MDYTLVAKDVFDFIDSVDFIRLKKEAKESQGKRNDLVMLKNKDKKQVGIFLANKFNISPVLFYYLQRIKKDGRFIGDVISGNKSVSEVIRILNGYSRNIEKQVYFIQEINTGRIKIGMTKNIKERYNKLCNSNAGELKILLLVKGFRKKELFFHKKFKKYHHHGEWFESSDEILDCIEGLRNEATNKTSIKK